LTGDPAAEGAKDGIIHAVAFPGNGQVRTLTAADLAEAASAPGWIWAHLDRRAEKTARILGEDLELPELVIRALLAEDTRPRFSQVGDGALLILRGVNLNPGAEPEDMVSLRIWVDARRIVSVRLRPLIAVRETAGDIAAGSIPATSMALAALITRKLVGLMGPVIASLDDELDHLEDSLLKQAEPKLRGDLTDLRHETIVLRRYIAPQRDALTQLSLAKLDLVDDLLRQEIRELADQVTRYVEDLDSIRERAAVVQDELTNRIAERLNANTYVLSLVAAIFLPLGLLTGLLGINVGGMPRVESPLAFWIVCVVLVVLGVFGVWLLRRFKWL